MARALSSVSQTLTSTTGSDMLNWNSGRDRFLKFKKNWLVETFNLKVILLLEVIQQVGLV